MDRELDIDAIVKAFERRRPLYEDFTRAIHEYLEIQIKAKGISDFRVNSRTKSVDSFKEKIVRPGKHYSDPLYQLTDLSGARVIVCYVDQLELVEQLIESEFNVDPESSVDKSRTLKPDTFGYLSVHYIITLPSEKVRLEKWSRFANMKAEIQVRTSLQDSWATVSHALQYKVIESAVPDSLKRRLFRLAGLFEIADQEFCQIKEVSQKRIKEVTKQFALGDTNMAIDSLSIIQFLNRSPLMIGIIQYAKDYSFKIDRQEMLEHYNKLDSSLVTEECVRLGIDKIETLEDLLKRTEKGNRDFVRLISSGRVWRTTSAFLLFLLIIKAYPNEFEPEYLVSKYGWDIGVAMNVITIAKKMLANYRY
jgi:putative GTP pyrophosphokinase